MRCAADGEFHLIAYDLPYHGKSIPPPTSPAAYLAIPGSTWQEMKGMGHFPMSENPERFVEYLLPLLDRIGAD